jgi:peptidoglycan/LPS O-acetylase OafA/YrhL
MIKKKNIELIDFLKGFSIFTIVIYHLLQLLKMPSIIHKFIAFGGTGVHTFIFISGFGLYLSYLNNPIGFVDFVKKRFIKIYIPYIIIVTFVALISLLIPIYPNSLYAYLGHLLFYKMFDESIIGSYGYQLWFISSIVQFYLFFYIFVALKNKLKNSYFLILGFAISLVWSMIVVYFSKEDLRIWNSFFPQFIWEFFLGMILANLYFTKGKEIWDTKIVYLFVIASIGLLLYSLLALKFGSLGKMFNDIPAFFGYTSIGILLYKLNLKWINRFILYIASISYSLYLIHMFVIKTGMFVFNYMQISYNFLFLVLLLLISIFFSVYLEKLLKIIYKKMN